ncbi:hypothetical protein CJ199_04545 [Brevibacterium paucivorans]|uniref:Uncharacterized protein n=1 Tax=Brevibacterium paucivorans TaxID=170994 RepID=A0A2N6VR61_9MICO|nr:hypothetical protein CJ199_04545 [Brevibacterium paucivorans]
MKISVERAIEGIEAVNAELTRELRALSGELLAMYKREERLLTLIENKERSNEMLRGLLASTKNQLQTLSNAPLPRLQRRYWTWRKAIRNRGNRNGGE